MSNLCKYFLTFFLKGISYLPFWILYRISDFLFVLVCYVVKYRKDVIDDNLANAFPKKSTNERRYLRIRFYRYLCDTSLETVKLYSMTEKQIKKRVIFSGVDELNAFANAGKSVILLAYHHNNWEWGSALQLQAKHRVLMVYNKMRNNLPMDNFLRCSRERWGGKAVQMGRAAKQAFDMQRQGIPTLLWLVADQRALATSQSWAKFLNREAAFFSGPEKIARKTNNPVFFQHVKRLGRGKYEINFSLLSENPKYEEPNAILLTYIQQMEQVIKSEPEYYLWSHKRWKHKRPIEIELIKD